MSLNEQEIIKLTDLLARVDNTQIKGEVWHELVKKFITVPVELCILDDQDRVLLVYRKDREFDGYHMPGSVVNDWETVADACKRLVQNEIVKGVGIHITEPKPIGWIEVRRGPGPDENGTRNQLSLLYISYFKGKLSPKDGVGFFPFDALPKNILRFHKFLIRRFRQYLKDKQPVLGK